MEGVEAALVRVKMSWARVRSGYLAYWGSEPMVAEVLMGLCDVRENYGLASSGPNLHNGLREDVGHWFREDRTRMRASSSPRM